MSRIDKDAQAAIASAQTMAKPLDDEFALVLDLRGYSVGTFFRIQRKSACGASRTRFGEMRRCDWSWAIASLIASLSMPNFRYCVDDERIHSTVTCSFLRFSRSQYSLQSCKG